MSCRCGDAWGFSCFLTPPLQTALVSFQRTCAVRWQAHEYEKPEFDKGPDGQLYFNGCRVLEEMPKRSILQRYKASTLCPAGVVAPHRHNIE